MSDLIILSSEINTRWNPSNKEHYIALGYKFTKANAFLRVKSSDLPWHSKSLVLVRCPGCGRLRKQPYRNTNILGHTLCTLCSRRRNNDLTGKTFGRWTVIEIGEKVRGSFTWLCECSCGTKRYVAGGDLTRRNGGSSSCGCGNIDRLKAITGSKHSLWKASLTQEQREHFRTRISPVNKQVLQRDGYTCQICQKHGGDLEAHHLDNWADHKEEREDTENLITLCKSCHKNYHSWNGGYYKPCNKTSFLEWKKL